MNTVPHAARAVRRTGTRSTGLIGRIALLFRYSSVVKIGTIWELRTFPMRSATLPEIYIERVPSRPTDPAALALTVLAKLLRD